MSNAFAADAVLTELAEAVQGAWSVSQVALRAPRTRQLHLPYAVIRIEELGANRDGPLASLGRVEQTMKFGILGRFPFPTDPSLNVELEKLTRVNELVAALQTGATFADGSFPLVTRADFREEDSTLNAAYEVAATFELRVSAPHH